MSRPLRVATVGTILWALTGCGGDSKPCSLLDLIPQVAVTWQAGALSYDEDSVYRLCVAEHCGSGAPLRFGDQLRVSLTLPDSYDEPRAHVRLELSGGGTDTTALKASRTITLRQTKEGCDQALTGALRLTAEGELEERT
ncbi:hypothetical protein J7I94_33650 [Streptomyces sp. ISL-12]|uniref:hypothetical protein n=1 Tax=Streptomyces sp. ISL-12 TaxID=2819177 RepID=UPI001BE60DF4|nr:hypothetical protein [Streptomyces sp. ISL-12]MBT2415424.1 hypothetical protein [Streptomyces sp. ISL-12]